jgi:hypothetical protein
MNRTIENQKFADIDIIVSYFDKLSRILLLRTATVKVKYLHLIIQLELVKGQTSQFMQMLFSGIINYV